MTKHTPGPWKVYSAPLRPNFPTPIIEVQDAEGTPIVKWGGFDGCDQPKGRVAANARLIASAPDLLAQNERLRAALIELKHYVGAIKNPDVQRIVDEAL